MEGGGSESRRPGAGAGAGTGTGTGTGPASNPQTSGTTDAQANANARGSFAVSAPSISLPKGGGAIRGLGEKFNADSISGAGSVTIPIATSPGRSGFGPELSLSYGSGAGNGPFGMGFNLSLPSIARKTDKGLPRYEDFDESDTFVLSGAEDLVPLLGPDGSRFIDASSVPGYTVHRYRPRIEGLFARIEKWTRADGDVYWRSISKDNVLTIYGKDEESRIADPQDPFRVFSWLICETMDDKGNAIVYRYKAEDGINVDLALAHEQNRGPRDDPRRKSNRYLKRILYGNRASQLDPTGRRPPILTSSAVANAGWMFEIVLDYGEHDILEPRPNDPGNWLARLDPFSSYRAGFEIRTYRLCQRVLMFHHFPQERGVGQDCLVQSTNFTFRGDTKRGDPILSFMSSASQTCYRRVNPGAYNAKSLPPVEFEYSPAVLHEQIREVDGESLENIPIGLDESVYKWTDLDGEAISGILTEQNGGWFYKRNTSPTNLLNENGQERAAARLEPVKILPVTPNVSIDSNQAVFLDLSGDGHLDLVQFNGPVRGFFTRTDGSTWTDFHAFKSWPNLDTHDPHFNFVDLSGDGLADILLTEDEALTWHCSQAEEGFGPATRLSLPLDEERGPRLLFNDNTQSIHLSDMSGDGLADLVRVRNGDICYWPNLGYGRFGAKVTMDNAPWFDFSDSFSQQRIRLADIDASGLTDIVYLGADKTDIYFNRAGNSFAPGESLNSVPSIDSLSSANIIDLLGDGTSCLVWSSPLPGHARRPLKYVELMGGRKPHLMVKIVNNLGAETHVHYAPSTKFYLADEAAGKPWVTKLPIVVHVVDRVDSVDLISRNRFVTTYKYHHGYFDGIEREFRGFGMVEQFDTESLAVLSSTSILPDETNIDKSSHVPPMLTRTWFHTGAYLDRDRISRHFAHEYYREGDHSESVGDLTDDEMRSLLLEDTLLPTAIDQMDGTSIATTLTVDEIREACRSLKGSVLRQEVYALDGTDKEDCPYTVSERNFAVKLLQPRGANKHAIFFKHAREELNFHYERKLVDVGGRKVADPRVSHSMTLAVDFFGHVLRSAEISYRRRDLPGVNFLEQQQTHMVLSVNRLINSTTEAAWQRLGLPAESRTYEIVRPPDPGTTNGRINAFPYGEICELAEALFPLTLDEPSPAVMWPYQRWDWRRNLGHGPDNPRLRLIDHSQTLYRKDDLSGPYPLGQVGSLALPYESYRLAFTPDLATETFVDSGKLTPRSLNNALVESKYVHTPGSRDWWIPSGRVFYSPDSTDTPEQELAYARQHFFVGHRYRDPFHTNDNITEVTVAFDTYTLLTLETRDPLGNRNTVGERDSAGNMDADKPGNDYRVLQPFLVTDPNGNRTHVAFDTLGMVVGTAVKGKADDVGDTLDGFDSDPAQVVLDEMFHSPNLNEQMAGLLRGATTRIIYDPNRFYHSKLADPDDSTKWKPTYTASLARETHVSDPLPPGELRIVAAFSFSDGFEREIQKKVQAEAGPLVDRGPSVSRRWVGSGWVIFNNKGKPVRQYEPFFSQSHDFEFAVQVGASTIMFYDPVGRAVATLRNHTFEKVVSDPWQQTSYDVNDTVVMDPANDGDIGDFVRRLQPSEYSPTWYDKRITGGLGIQEQQAAEKAAVHANTPTVSHLDSLGRVFVTVSHNKARNRDAPANSPPLEDFYQTRLVFDMEGSKREVIDAKDRIVMRSSYDMLGLAVVQSSMEAGERWTLNDIGGKPAYGWNSRGYRFRSVYDQLQRPVESYLGDGSGSERLVGRTVYGETETDAESRNLRARTVRIFDQAGVLVSSDYDFKGNLLSSQRQMAVEYKTTLDWSTTVALETETYAHRTTYDALNRAVESTLPDGTVVRTSYNEAGLLDKIDARLRGATASAPFIKNINYNARRQRELVEYGNGVTTLFEHDPATFRLTHMLTRRDPVDFPGDQVQNLRYTYDPAGNITHIRDDSQQSVFFRNKRVDPSNEYTYDAVYQLIEASGREHLGQVNGVSNAPAPPGPFSGDVRHDNPNDGNAMGTYLERYLYDAAGNVESMKHSGSDPRHPGWTRDYRYNEMSQLEPGKKSNRLSSTSIGSTTEAYRYDGSAGLHGNVTAMPHLPFMQWDFKDQLQATSGQVVANGGTPEITWYVYDATGRRIRKVTERQSAPGTTPTRLKERIYLGSLELFRTYDGDGSEISKEYETVHIMDDRQRLAMIETRTQGTDRGPGQLIRYQISNHLGSATLELDDGAQIISYEEFTAYGATVYQAVNSETEVPKRYRYGGMERDTESGLQYHGTRYYAPWLGRWTACDPAGTQDGLNLYAYVRGNPILMHDPSGTEGEKPSKTKPASKKPTAAPKKPVGDPYVAPVIPADLKTSTDPKYITDGKGHKVEVEYFPGTSGETMIIVGGQHRSEPRGIDVSKALQKELHDSRDKPGYYNIVFVPNLYADRPVTAKEKEKGTARFIDGVDPNRNMPAMGESVDDAVKRGGGVALDASGERQINAENLILLALVEQFKPTRALQIHDKGFKPTADIINQGEAGTFVDAKVGGNAQAAHDLAGEAATLARDTVGERAVRGNFITKAMVKGHDAKYKGTEGYVPGVEGLRTLYPNGTATVATKGVTFGEWGSHKGGMDVYLVEAVSGATSQDVVKWTSVIRATYLAGPKPKTP